MVNCPENDGLPLTTQSDCITWIGLRPRRADISNAIMQEPRFCGPRYISGMMLLELRHLAILVASSKLSASLNTLMPTSRLGCDNTKSSAIIIKIDNPYHALSVAMIGIILISSLFAADSRLLFATKVLKLFGLCKQLIYLSLSFSTSSSAHRRL